MFGRRPKKRIEVIHSDHTEETTSDDGISLEDLSQAYAAVLKPRIAQETLVDDAGLPQDAGIVESGVGEAEVVPLDAPFVGESDGVTVTAESIVEAILFVGSRENAVVPLEQIREVLGFDRNSDIEECVERLNRNYVAARRAVTIIKETGGFALRLAPDMEHVRDQFYGKQRQTQLTQPAVDCLSLVAYQPGITKTEIEAQWNQPAGAVLGSLVRKGLLRLESQPASAQGERRIEGNYFTTDKFLEILGIESLADLPRGDDLE